MKKIQEANFLGTPHHAISQAFWRRRKVESALGKNCKGGNQYSKQKSNPGERK